MRGSMRMSDTDGGEARFAKGDAMPFILEPKMVDYLTTDEMREIERRQNQGVRGWPGVRLTMGARKKEAGTSLDAISRAADTHALFAATPVVPSTGACRLWCGNR